jgi:hypothetical protein
MINKFNSFYKKIRSRYLINSRGYNKIYNKWKVVIDKNELESLLLLNIIPIKIIKINISELKFHITADEDSNLYNYAVQDSPHVKLLNKVAQRGEEYVFSHYMDLEYTFFLKNQKYKYNYFNGEVISRVMSEQQILSRIKSFIGVYNSIKTNGYLNPPFAKRPICILDQPFWNTRYGAHLPNSLKEVFIGHHRLASLCALGQESINVVLLRDVHGSTMTMNSHYNFLKIIK